MADIQLIQRAVKGFQFTPEALAHLVKTNSLAKAMRWALQDDQASREALAEHFATLIEQTNAQDKVNLTREQIAEKHFSVRTDNDAKEKMALEGKDFWGRLKARLRQFQEKSVMWIRQKLSSKTLQFKPLTKLQSIDIENKLELGSLEPRFIQSENFKPLDPNAIEIRIQKGDEVMIGGNPRLVTIQDLQRHNLMPTHAFNVPGLSEPIYASRLINLQEGRVGFIMYVPENGRYIPRPVYQSNSHISWQAPSSVLRFIHEGECRLHHFGKGPGRGKTETCLQPTFQKALSKIAAEAGDVPENDTDLMLWTGISRQPNQKLNSQFLVNHPSILEGKYPECKIQQDLLGDRRLLPNEFVIPDEAMPIFSAKPLISYPIQNKMFGRVQAEVYYSQDKQLLWTVFKQESTGRVWIGHAHGAEETITRTGLPENLVDLGLDLPSSPYEYGSRLRYPPGSSLKPPKVAHPDLSEYVDIWEGYTSQIPIIQAYYKAKGLRVPA